MRIDGATYGMPVDDLSVVRGFKQVWAHFYRGTEKQGIGFLEE